MAAAMIKGQLLTGLPLLVSMVILYDTEKSIEGFSGDRVIV